MSAFDSVPLQILLGWEHLLALETSDFASVRVLLLRVDAKTELGLVAFTARVADKTAEMRSRVFEETEALRESPIADETHVKVLAEFHWNNGGWFG